MSPEAVIDLFRHTLFIVIIMVSVIILPGLIVGLLVSVFQAATQINEQTLSFVPRLLVTMLSLMVFGPWLMSQLLSFFEEILMNIGEYLV